MLSYPKTELQRMLLPSKGWMSCLLRGLPDIGCNNRTAHKAGLIQGEEEGRSRGLIGRTHTRVGAHARRGEIQSFWIDARRSSIILVATYPGVMTLERIPLQT